LTFHPSQNPEKFEKVRVQDLKEGDQVITHDEEAGLRYVTTEMIVYDEGMLTGIFSNPDFTETFDEEDVVWRLKSELPPL
jgi:intein/homing endonuclease